MRNVSFTLFWQYSRTHSSIIVFPKNIEERCPAIRRQFTIHDGTVFQSKCFFWVPSSELREPAPVRKTLLTSVETLVQVRFYRTRYRRGTKEKSLSCSQNGENGAFLSKSVKWWNTRSTETPPQSRKRNGFLRGGGHASRILFSFAQSNKHQKCRLLFLCLEADLPS